MTRPRYRDLAVREDAPRGTSWGVYGADDEIGTLNEATPDRAVAAASLVREGVAFPLSLPLDEPDPPLFGRRGFTHTVVQEPTSLDDRIDDLHPQASSQWDSLAHVRHPELGFYNGVPAGAVGVGRGSRLGIDRWGARGIAARFVLLDVARHRASYGRPIRWDARELIGVDDLVATAVAQGVELAPGSAVLVRTGWLAGYRAASREERARIAAMVPSDDLSRDRELMPPTPGLAASEDLAAWLWDVEAAAIVADNPALEAMPFERDSVDGWLHYRLIPMLGMAVGELWDLDALAEHCAREDRWEGLLTAAPLRIPGGIGSPANALALM
ncbi:cyclase family protein [Protaetiibacter sp. SSC-01]|uniref:cyclase family protein n=1 Tax=Protaetiibacter sp. SSC-01 TaxID=2759943 RepID=UPI001657635F|nr:cyclase family protein [Protaetiibacter sp. SSC-01]QNO36889.1 cyclase family protein [Protaetiibacter sp. SSC-01]